MIDLGGIAALKGIRETADGLEIGALTTLAEVANNALIRERYGLLAKAAAHVASPQIRNQGTLGGNVCQDARCWYYRSGLDCYRAGGNTCYADTPQGMNREHCLFGRRHRPFGHVVQRVQRQSQSPQHEPSRFVEGVGGAVAKRNASRFQPRARPFDQLQHRHLRKFSIVRR